MRFPATLLALALTAASAPASVVPIVPRIPRAAFPAAPPDDATDPAKLAERIAANVRAAGDKLRQKDAGTATRKAQADALRDIDKLLDQAENPPPPPTGGGEPPPMPPPMGGDSPPPPPMGGGQGQPKPTGGQPQGKPGQGQPKPGGKPSWRDKADEPGDPAGPKPMPQSQPIPPGQPAPIPATPGGPAGPGTPAGGPVKLTPGRPAEDAVAKQVWGHLPERLRQEMNQYYTEQFMPKYSDLLKQYYGTLADREKAPRR